MHFYYKDVEKKTWIFRSKVEKLNAVSPKQLGARPFFGAITDARLMKKIGFNCQLFQRNMINYEFES